MLAGDYVDGLSSERVRKERKRKKSRISIMFNLAQNKVSGRKY